MKKFTFSLILLSPFFLLLFFSSPRIVDAQCVQTGEVCDTYTSVQKACCNTTDKCVDSGQGTRIKICKQIPNNCKCDTPNQAGSGVNGFKCDFEGTKKSGFCDNADQACIQGSSSDVYYDTNWVGGGDEPAQGVRCQKPASTPASPPCKEYDNEGRCISTLTSFGEIGTAPEQFISSLFGILLAASGTIALILFMRAGYQIMTARGNPEGIKEGREKLVAAILGLMFIIFSFVLLEVIGVDLLRLPTSSNSSNRIPPEVSCSNIPGVCMPRGACTPDDGRVDGVRGCNTGTICCIPN